MESFECDVCCNMTSRVSLIECSNCHYKVCTVCQQQYAHGDCIKCHMKFRRQTIIEYLGQEFFDNVIKPQIIGELMREQKEQLKYVQPLVDWMKERHNVDKMKRYGCSRRYPPKPFISADNNYQIQSQSQKYCFPCPISECRGFVQNGACGLCHSKICLNCHEIIQPNHACKPELVRSIRKLESDSKPCPRCCAMIYRTEGCTHMYCTHCQTYFDWETMEIMTKNTNDHYIHLKKFADNIPTINVGSDGLSTSTDQSQCHYNPIIPTNKSLINPILYSSLWGDSATIHLIVDKKYNRDLINRKSRETLEHWQIKYLQQEISEKVWESKVYQCYLSTSLSQLYAEVLDIYLSTVRYLQFNLTRDMSQQNQTLIMDQYNQLVELTNQSFKSIQEEYGGPIHHIRRPDEPMHVPRFS